MPQPGPWVEFAADRARVVVPPGIIPGGIERIEILQDGEVVASASFAIGLPARSGSYDLQPWPRTASAELTTIIFFRVPQPAAHAPAPLSRSAFRLRSSDIRDLAMTSSAAPQDAGTEEFAHALLAVDFGTSRSVTSKYSYGEAKRAPRRPLSEVARSRAFAHIELEPDPAIFSSLQLEIETAGDPEWQEEAWSIVFTTPPLQESGLAATVPMSSAVWITDQGEVTIVDQAQGQPSEKVTTHHGVKRWLRHPEENLEGTSLEAGQVIGAIYRDLVAAEQKQEAGLRFPWLYVTYPVTLPADLKDDLGHGLGDLAKLVELRVDEAAAAASFWVMNEFGADPVLGAEAFKAASRCPEGYFAWERPDLWERARAWHQYYLVIDIGGGTTDCALIKVVLRDDTPSEANAAAARFYVVAPQVMSSGGEFDIGGDMITLAIFRLLKDKLGVDDETKFDGLTDGTARRQAFDELWKAAEAVKIAGLATEEPASITVVTSGREAEDTGDEPYVVAAELNSAAWNEQGSERALPGEVVVLAAELAEIADAVANRVADIAEGIALGGLPANGASDQGTVDRVIFSGGSVISGNLRAGIENLLRAHLTDSTFETSFDQEYSKAGTALGAAWLGRWIAFKPEPRAVIDKLNAGRAYFGVDASRLHVNLAADFAQLGQSENETLVLTRGTPLTAGPGGQRAAVSEKGELLPTMVLRRGDRRKGYEKWGQFPIGSDSYIEWLSEQGVEARFEIDEDETPFVLLSVGRPVHDLSGGTPLSVTGSQPLVLDGVLVHDLVQDGTPADISLRNPLSLLSAGTDLGTATTVPVRPGLVHRQLPSEPDDNDTPADERHRISYQSVGIVPDGHRWLSVSGDGSLRTFADHPGLLEVPAIDDVISTPGAVFRGRLKSVQTYDKNKDPFSGIH